MSRPSAGEWAGRIAAFLFAAAAVTFGVVILVSWIASWFGVTAGGAVLAFSAAVPVVALAYRIFAHERSGTDTDAISDEEQS